MAEFIAQGIKRIKEMQILPVRPKFDAEQPIAELLHPDNFVAGTEVALRELLSVFDRGRLFLGERLARMVTSDAVLPLGIKYFGETGKIRLIHGGDERGAYDIDPCDPEMQPFSSLNLDFAVVEMVALPPIDSSHYWVSVIEDDAAIAIPIDADATIKMIVSHEPPVTLNAYAAAIAPPQIPLFMQGARMMLIRPKLV